MFGRVKTEIFYPYPPQQVWRVLTDRQALSAWLMDNDFEPRIGHKFQFRTNSLPGLDEIIYCQVLELDEPKRLAYTWCDSLIGEQSIVTWTLEAVEGGTQHLHHRVVESLAATSLGSAHIWDRESMRDSNKATVMLLPCDRNIPTGYSLPNALSRSRQHPDNSFKPVSITFCTQGDEWDYRLQQLPKILISLAFNNKWFA